MSEKRGEESESIAEVILPTVRSSQKIRDLIDDLCWMEVRGIEVKARKPTDVMREALMKGLQQMVVEIEERKKKEAEKRLERKDAGD